MAAAALGAGHEAIVVSGPVELTYPARAEVVPVVKVDSRIIGDGKPGPITRDLMQRFHELTRA